jgi:hypothetical protein
VIGLPPLLAGTAQLTVAWPFPAVAVTADGAPGGPVGMTLFDGDDAGPGPMALVAMAVKV